MNLIPSMLSTYHSHHLDLFGTIQIRKETKVLP
ncbi:hypothetical protein NC651_004419 [Populus alba x Populus x berolinensis]|nr:hypothetical protein NC651_004419 [Populus alba x Populus x berolinensis]